MSNPTIWVVTFNADHFYLETKIDFEFDQEVSSWKEIAHKADKLIKDLYGFSPLAMSNDYSVHDENGTMGR